MPEKTPSSVESIKDSPVPTDETGSETDNLKKGPTGWHEAIQSGDDLALDSAVSSELTAIIRKYKLEKYDVLLLFDETDSITNFHSDRLYAAATAMRRKADVAERDILLILHSNGGSIEPAYIASKTLKRMAKEKFVVAVPRRAKSAATLLALGADEIHMGLNSQLGPIDPQVSGLPVLAIGNALDVIADLTCRFPAASEMFTKYLAEQIPIQTLGYYQRISESAVQYAERLFAGRKLADKKTPEEVAKHLVNHYKDHGFVIDFDEARSLLGKIIIRDGTPEYHAADEIFQLLDKIKLFLNPKQKYFWHVGSIADGFVVAPKRRQT